MSEHQRVYRRAVLALRGGKPDEAARLGILAYEIATGRTAEDGQNEGH